MNNKTIHFFKEISKIPRESGNEEKISEYICDFAKQRNLYCFKDEYNNVLIKKKNADCECIILQAHMDMVCEKNENIDFDFKNEGLNIYEENGYLKAKGTTLGADNGIGVAQILNILDSDLKCNIEAIFTVAEETTMIGASNFDTSKLFGKKMINLDGFEENTIIVESACFYDILMKSDYTYEASNKLNSYKIRVLGLLGGHSGFDIDKNRGNASILLTDILSKFEELEISDFKGGTKFNVIPSSAYAVINTDMEYEKLAEKINLLKKNLISTYPNIEITLEKIEKIENSLGVKNTKKFISAVSNFNHGVYFYNLKNKPTTSVNLGVVDLKEKVMKIGMRSSKKEEEKNCLESLKKFATENDLKFEILGSQPGFESKENSSLIQNLKKVYPDENKETLNVKSVHITVEAGFFAEKIEGLEIAIISPRIDGAHTPEEKVYIDSVRKVDKWLYNLLELLQTGNN